MQTFQTHQIFNLEKRKNMKFLNVDNVKQVFRLEKFDYPVFHEILAKLIWNIFIVVGIRWRTQSCHNLWERGAAPPSLPVSSVTRNGSNSYFFSQHPVWCFCRIFEWCSKYIWNLRVYFIPHLGNDSGGVSIRTHRISRRKVAVWIGG